MKSLFIFFLFCLIFPCRSFAQAFQKLLFEYRCVPTSTTDYSIVIGKDEFTLTHREKIPNKRGVIRKVDSSHYSHFFDFKEKETLDSIIKVNKLDSVGLYQNRTTEWGTLWQIEIQKNSITYKIDLPNYNNVGLESLIHFILCLIPSKELPLFECKKCRSQ